MLNFLQLPFCLFCLCFIFLSLDNLGLHGPALPRIGLPQISTANPTAFPPLQIGVHRVVPRFYDDTAFGPGRALVFESLKTILKQSFLIEQRLNYRFHE